MSVVHEAPVPAFGQPSLGISWEASCKTIPWHMKTTLGQKSACSEAVVATPDTRHLCTELFRSSWNKLATFELQSIANNFQSSVSCLFLEATGKLSSLLTQYWPLQRAWELFPLLTSPLLYFSLGASLALEKECSWE